MTRTQIEKEERVISMAWYIIENQATIRETAKKFGIPKSTVYNDVTKWLYNIDTYLYKEVRKVLDINKKERASRGGQALARKWKQIKSN